ncbi:MAG: DinB family protein [Bacillota bacterium]
MKIEAAVAALKSMPDALEKRLAGLSEAQLRYKPGPDSFSALENVCHLRDIEVEGYACRLRLMLETENPVLPDLDGSTLAKARRYNEQLLAPALETFVIARRGNLQRLAAATPADLARRGRFENVGDVTLERLLELWVEHDQEHIRELDELLRTLCEPARTPKPSLSLARG